MEPDQDDIIRVIDEDSEEECAAEITRLKRKRKGYRAAFTEIQNIIDRLITASRGPDNKLNRSEDNRFALQRASEKLEQRYEKLQKLNQRILSINFVEEDDAAYQDAIDVALNLYTQRIDNLGALRIAMLPNPNQQWAGGAGAGIGAGLNLRTVEALKPSFSMSFDNSPTELSTWLSQFKSYFEASRLHTVPLDQQQAFLRSNLASDVWTVIKQKINNDTRVFHNSLDPDEESCERVIEEAF